MCLVLEKDKSFGKQDTRVFGQKKAKAEISRIHRLKIINKKHLIWDNKKKNRLLGNELKQKCSENVGLATLFRI